MNSSIERLRCELAAPLDHPDFASLREWGNQALGWLVNHWSTLPDQGIGNTGARAELEKLLHEPPPETGSDFADVLAQFDSKVASYSFRVNHPRFFAFIPSAPNYVSVLADFLCAGTNFFAGVWRAASGPSQIELVVLDWFKQFLGYPKKAGGILTGGGSEANLIALLVARQCLSSEQRSSAVLYTSAERHWSIDRAAYVIGLQPSQLRIIETDRCFRLRPQSLQSSIAEDRAAGRLPWAVIANAGATSTGVVDPLASLSSICRKQRLWLHVDAAYGWSAVLVPEGRKRLEGIASADSITLDPHKWFAQPFEIGCLLVREGNKLRHTFAIRPDYMHDVEPASDWINFADHGLALTRRFRALKIWMSMKVLGLSWFRELVERSLRLAELAEALLQKRGEFEILGPRQLSIVCFRYLPPVLRQSANKDEQELDRINLAIIDCLQASGRACLSSTRLTGRVALRLCFVNWQTTTADVEEVVDLLSKAGANSQPAR